MAMSDIHFFDVTAADEGPLEALAKELLPGQAAEFHSGPTAAEPNAVVVSPFVTSEVTADLMAQLPKLKLIACRSTGYDHIDLKEAARRGITVCNVPSYGENTVAEYAFGLLLA